MDLDIISEVRCLNRNVIIVKNKKGENMGFYQSSGKSGTTPPWEWRHFACLGPDARAKTVFILHENPKTPEEVARDKMGERIAQELNKRNIRDCFTTEQTPQDVNRSIGSHHALEGNKSIEAAEKSKARAEKLSQAPRSQHEGSRKDGLGSKLKRWLGRSRS